MARQEDIPELKRAWFDRLDPTFLSGFKLQASISQHLLDVGNVKQHYVETELKKFSANMTSTSKVHSRGINCSASLIASHAIACSQREFSDSIRLHDSQCSIQTDLQFIDNMLLMDSISQCLPDNNSNNINCTKENFYLNSIEENRKDSQQNQISINHPIHGSTFNRSNFNKDDIYDAKKACHIDLSQNEQHQRKQTLIQQKQSHNVESHNPSVQKKYPFKTARDKFIEEGGVFKNDAAETNNDTAPESGRAAGFKRSLTNNSKDKNSKDGLPPELQHCDKEVVERIEADIIQHGQAVTFADIAGLEFAKKCVQELICWPMLRPDLFTGLRSLPRGLLLFGPPGTGKTLIGKAIAHQAGATFFCISSSSLTSKWIGEGEKAVRTLFAVAVYRQPAVIFIDEIDSLLCQRSAEENEASRRIKTEFLVQLDGAGTDQNARVVVIGATNRPEELDEAARRRFVKRIYIPLPDETGRLDLFLRLMRADRSCHSLTDTDFSVLVQRTGGFSGADIRSLCTEAAMGPVREIAVSLGSLQHMSASDVPPISMRHFLEALEVVVPSVSPSDLTRYVDWNSLYGSYRRME